MTREEIILPLIKGREVLDVGSVNEDGRHSLWNFMKAEAGRLTGIDLRPSKEKNVVLGNMERYVFGRKFEVVVAGDVLIQTDNQGLFLDNINRHLGDRGKLIITLPNAKWPTVFLRPSPFQTGWHDRFTLEQILLRHGFCITALHYYYGNRHTFRLLRQILFSRQGIVAICEKQ